jgi:beta-N-acetylhexosaminidase
MSDGSSAGLSGAELRDKAGARLLIGWTGADPREIIELLEEFRPAGCLCFRRNRPEGPDGLAGLADAIRAANRRAARLLGRPLLWAVDQEGGSVQRFPDEGLALPPASELGDLARGGKRGLDKIRALARRSGLALRALGFNFNLGPVLDVAAPESYIASRSFSRDPSLAAEAARAWAEGFGGAGLLVCGKHFPGLGRARRDPHKELPEVTAPARELWDWDGLPFRELIRRGLPAVMTSHALWRSLDASLPATRSKKILRLLKSGYNFRGLAVSDDLEMEGARDPGGPGAAALAAFAAGHDLLIVSQSRKAAGAARGSLMGALSGGRLGPRLRNAERRLTRTLRKLPG